ncbi:MAG: hypothetical protein QXE32_00855 [Sulfolobales archaeon]
MSNISYKLYLIRVSIGVIFAWIYTLVRSLLVIGPDPIDYIVLSTSLMVSGVVVGGYISRLLGYPFRKYVITQIAVYYLSTVIL